MRSPLTFVTLTSTLLMTFFSTVTVHAEFQCSPVPTIPASLVGDRFFPSTVATWVTVTKSRYTEGECSDVKVPGYDNFPTKRCLYANADAGAATFASLQAEVIVLNPSSQQLAIWSINACRVNGATDAQIPKCLRELRNYIVANNGAQFPIVGSVVESYCNSSTLYGTCNSLAETNKWRRPRNTWFRDGIAIDYVAMQGLKWDDTIYPKSAFDAVFNVSFSDVNIKNTYSSARLAGASREQWTAWRKHIGKPDMPDGGTGSVYGAGWRIVAAAVHKAACRGGQNELFDAVVFANASWMKP